MFGISFNLRSTFDYIGQFSFSNSRTVLYITISDNFFLDCVTNEYEMSERSFNSCVISGFVDPVNLHFQDSPLPLLRKWLIVKLRNRV